MDAFESWSQTLMQNLRIAVVILVGLLLFILCKQNRRHWCSKQSPPGPMGIPFIGHLPFMTRAPHVKFTEWSKKYGDVFRIQLGIHPTVIVNGLETIKGILLTNDNHLRRAISGRPIFPSFDEVNGGDSMLFKDYQSNPMWAIKKRAMRQALSGFMIQNKGAFEEIVIRKSKTITDMMIKQGPADMKFLLSMSTIQMMLEMSSYSVQGEEDNATSKKHVAVIGKQFMKLAEQSINAVSDILPWLRVFFKSRLKDFRQTNDVITKAYEDLLSDNVKSFDEKNPRDLADHFLTSFSRTAELQDRVRDVKNLQLMSEFLGAFESTTGAILNWAFVLCAAFPEEQAKLHEELDQQIGEAEVRMDALGRLTRLKAFLQEVKRFAVVMPLQLPHRTIARCQLGGFDVPENTLIFFNVWSALRDPRHWGDPNVFRPDRFLTEDGDLDYKRMYGFLHFGAGDRRCPGQRMGTAANTLIFANILRCCRIVQADDSKIDLEPQVLFNLMPKPVKLLFKPIQA